MRVPANVELEDRLAFGLTGRQLAVLAATVVCAYGLESLLAALLPTPVALAAALLVGAAGITLALARHAGLRGEQLALALARFALAPRRLVLAPDGLPGPLPGAHAQRIARLEPPVRRILASGLVELADGSHCRILAARGTSFALRGADEQAAFVAAFGRFLNGASEPLQIVVQREPASLEGHVRTLERGARELAPGIRAAAAEHARFLRRLGEGEGPLLRRRILLVLRSSERLGALAEAALSRAAAQASELLGGAEISLEPLAGEEVAALLARSLDPPGPPAGSGLEGLIRARSSLPARPQPDAGPGLLGPPSLELGAERVRVGGLLRQTYAVSGYPHEVVNGWLGPLLSGGAELDLSLHVEPFPAELAARRLHKQRARFESTRRLERERGGLADLAVAAAAEDSHALAGRLARGESRLFRAGLYLTVAAASDIELADSAARLRALCSSQLLSLIPTSFRAQEGWRSSLPLGVDRLRLRRTFDTEALAASFPFAAAEPPFEEGGSFYGTSASGAPVVYDRFAADNYNSVVLARSGAGKSYLAKLEALRLLYRGVQVFVVDPEDEYARLCRGVGGVYLPLAGEAAVALNPLDLRGVGAAAIAERVAFLGELVELMAGPLGRGELAALDRAARALYAASPGASPLLSGLVSELAALGPQGTRLAERLGPYASGSLSALFARPTTLRPEGELVCFSLRGLPDTLKPVALCLCLDAIWHALESAPRRRCVLVDEAWLVVSERAGAAFLYRLAKSARKRWCGLTTITQDAGDLLGSELGQAIVANAASQILLRQAPQAIDRVAAAFGLSEGERRYLLTCPRGHGLFVVGDERFPLRIRASEAEHRLATSDPAELAALA